jgi:alpha,alpha-trehalase
VSKLPLRKPARIVLAITLATFGAAAQVAQRAPQPILDYIRQTWTALTRGPEDLAQAAIDPKFHALPNGRWPVYIARSANPKDIEQEIADSLPPAQLQTIQLLPLPLDPRSLRDHGLLYLPRSYVVPGGRFNEMYGWDSYFIQLGLIHDGEETLARNMADNFLYQIREYGRILNANRTYYLTRSQPPFLTQMILGVYRTTKDRDWLSSTLPAIQKYYDFWTQEPHLTGAGLSRYFDLGEGPAPEVVASEHDAQGRSHYDVVKEYFRTRKVTAYDLTQYYDRKTGQLTPLFYKGDRSMRESGFDPSNRFGPFSIDIIHYNPVCLNSLLYLMEVQTAEILDLLGRGGEAVPWRERANRRAALVNRLMWNQQDGLYYDYNFARRSMRKYPFLTTFYPLWAGIADRKQAARVAANLPLFEKEGGLQTSTNRSGSQWDAPFGWAPLQLIAVQGLRRYGYQEAADRIAAKFLKMVRDDYRRRGTIVEKYDVVRAASDVGGDLRFGYRSNEVGFGWTNAVFTVLLDELSPQARQKVMSALPQKQAASSGRDSLPPLPH